MFLTFSVPDNIPACFLTMRSREADVVDVLDMLDDRPSKRSSPASGTAFAPAELAATGELEAGIATLVAQPLVSALLDATDVSVLVLNRQRQVLVGNSVLLKSLEPCDPCPIVGRRPGDVFGCVWANACPGGCGTTPECCGCGAVLAILECQRTGATVERDCLMTARRSGQIQAQELRVRASSLSIGEQTFTVVGVRDVSAEKRRDALERVFLHDISNTLSPLLNWSHVLAARVQGRAAEIAERVSTIAKRLQRDIQDQRSLIQAEDGTLTVEFSTVHLIEALRTAATIVREKALALGITIEVSDQKAEQTLVTDESLLVRVLVNMLKNAVEATACDGRVRAWANQDGECSSFHVWNAGAIPPEIAIHVFKRSFSSKTGRGRGLGTFSMKLFGETYLGGTVEFTSTESDGTIFSVRLPNDLAANRG